MSSVTNYDANVNTSFLKAIDSTAHQSAINFYNENLIDSLDQLHFNRFLGIAFKSSDQRAGEIYSRLLQASQIQQIGPVEQNLLTFNYASIPDALTQADAQPSVLCNRTIEYLQTNHALAISKGLLERTLTDFPNTQEIQNRVNQLLGRNVQQLQPAPNPGSWWPCSIV